MAIEVLPLQDNDKKMALVVLKFLRGSKLDRSLTTFTTELKEVYDFDLIESIQYSAEAQAFLAGSPNNAVKNKLPANKGGISASEHNTHGTSSTRWQPKSKPGNLSTASDHGALRGARGRKYMTRPQDDSTCSSDPSSSSSSDSDDSKQRRRQKKEPVPTITKTKSSDSEAETDSKKESEDVARRAQLRNEWATKLAKMKKPSSSEHGDDSVSSSSMSSSTASTLSPVKKWESKEATFDELASIRENWKAKLARLRQEGSVPQDDSSSSSSGSSSSDANFATKKSSALQETFLSAMGSDPDDSSNRSEEDIAQVETMKSALSRLCKLRTKEAASDSSSEDSSSSSSEVGIAKITEAKTAGSSPAFEARSKRRAKRNDTKEGKPSAMASSKKNNAFRRSVSFSDDDQVQEIPRDNQKYKAELFYNKSDIRRFTVEETTRRQQEQVERMAAMISAFSVNTAKP